jgi:hypothetical protein
MAPKKVCHTPVGQKLREEIDFLKTGCFWPTRAIPLRLADLTPLPINYLNGLGLVLKILSISFHPLKNYSTFNLDKQTNALSSTYRWVKYFYALFHFTTFASLTLLMFTYSLCER